MFDNFFIFLFLNAFERTGRETVPTAIPAIAKINLINSICII